MRFKMITLFSILLLAGFVASRFQYSDSLEGNGSTFDRSGWMPIQMRSKDNSQSRYLGNAENISLIFNNHNNNRIRSLSINNKSNLSSINFPLKKSSRLIVNNHVENEWMSKSYSQTRISHKINDNRYSHGTFNLTEREIIKKIIPNSNHVSQRDTFIEAQNQGKTVIKETLTGTDYDGQYISARNRNYVKIIPGYYNRVPTDVQERIKNNENSINNQGYKNQVKTDKVEFNGEYDLIKEERLNSSKKEYLINSADGPAILKSNSQVSSDGYLKDWPHKEIQAIKDNYNYEKYTSLLNYLTQKPQIYPNQLPDDNTGSEMNTSIGEIIQWLKFPPLKSNHSQFTERPVSTASQLIYQDSGFNDPSRLSEGSSIIDEDKPIKGQFYSAGTMINSNPIRQRPVYQSSVQANQNIVVHIINSGSKTPNVTITESELPPKKSPVINQTSASPPNVHIMFMDDEIMNASQKIPSVPGLKNDCPTIMINSITEVNNSIQSKESCADLNIVINSHVLNQNILMTSTGINDNRNDAEHIENSDQSMSDELLNPDRSQYINQVLSVTDNNNQNYNTEIQIKNNFTSGEQGVQEEEEEEVSGESLNGSSFEISQATNIQIGSINNDNEKIADQTAAAAAAQGGSLTDYVQAPEASQFSESSLIQNVEEYTADIPSDSSVNLNIPGGDIPNLPGLISSGENLSNNDGQLSNVASAPAGGAADNDEDEDDIDMLSPVGMMESMSSMFSYFNYLNPLNYGIFGVAIAPFTAFAAGLLGVAAFLFPWAFPTAFDFARSSDSVKIGLISGLEEVVKQSIRKYRNWNEWKSRRKKRMKR